MLVPRRGIIFPVPAMVGWPPPSNGGTFQQDYGSLTHALGPRSEQRRALQISGDFDKDVLLSSPFKALESINTCFLRCSCACKPLNFAYFKAHFSTCLAEGVFDMAQGHVPTKSPHLLLTLYTPTGQARILVLQHPTKSNTLLSTTIIVDNSKRWVDMCIWLVGQWASSIPTTTCFFLVEKKFPKTAMQTHTTSVSWRDLEADFCVCRKGKARWDAILHLFYILMWGCWPRPNIYIGWEWFWSGPSLAAAVNSHFCASQNEILPPTQIVEVEDEQQLHITTSMLSIWSRSIHYFISHWLGHA